MYHSNGNYEAFANPLPPQMQIKNLHILSVVGWPDWPQRFL